MSFGVSAATWAMVGAGTALAGTVLQSGAASDAAQAQTDATNASIGEQRRQFDLTREDYAPYREAGKRGLAQYETEIGQPVTAADVMQDPGYQFGLTQGQTALDRKIAAMGGRVSGAALMRPPTALRAKRTLIRSCRDCNQSMEYSFPPNARFGRTQMTRTAMPSHSLA